jgi:hypothetical protein
MCYADQQGLFNVVQAMKKFAANPLDDATFWQPAPLLARLAAEGQERSPDAMTDTTTMTQRRHRLHRPHAAGQELEGRLQHDPWRHARRPRGARRRRPRGHRPGRRGGRADGLRQPRRRHRRQHRPPVRADGRPARGRARHDRQPLLLQRPADHRAGRAAHRRGRGRRVRGRRRGEHLVRAAGDEPAHVQGPGCSTRTSPRSTGTCCRPPSRWPSATA